MEPEFDDELLQLKNALRQETFRFIIIGHNRYSIYQDIANWLDKNFPERPPFELRLTNKDYRRINNEIVAFKKRVVLIPDFSWLFRDENEAICVAFNQRRDAFARLDIALVCFIGLDEFTEIPKKVPDWWSLRSLELYFHRETADVNGEFLRIKSNISSLGGQTKEEKEAEIERLLRQTEVADAKNKSLLFSLYSQIATLLFELSHFKTALSYLEHSLLISQQIGDKWGEGDTLNNIGEIYNARGDYETALNYLGQSLLIRQQIGDKWGEGDTLNNIGEIYNTRGDYETALNYLGQSLLINQQIGYKKKEGDTLNNIGEIYNTRGDYETALNYLERSLLISQQIGDKRGEGITLNNLATSAYARGDYETALSYLSQSLLISQQIGDKWGEGDTLNNTGQVYNARGDYETALSYLERSLLISQQIGDKRGEGITLNNIGAFYWEQYQNVKKAIPLLRKAYTILTQIGSPDSQLPENYSNIIRRKIGEENFNKIVQAIPNESPS